MRGEIVGYRQLPPASLGFRVLGLPQVNSEALDRALYGFNVIGTQGERVDPRSIQPIYGPDAEAIEPLDPHPMFWPPLTTLAAFVTHGASNRPEDEHAWTAGEWGLALVVLILAVVFMFRDLII